MSDIQAHQDTIDSSNVLTHDTEFGVFVNALLADPGFSSAYGKLDMEKLSANFNKFDSSIIDYTAFHRMETRLWAIKLGKGRMRLEDETLLKGKVKGGMEAYQNAFLGIEGCINAFVDAGFDKVLDSHLPRLMEMVAEEDHPFREIWLRHMTVLGFTPAMLAEAHSQMKAARYNVMQLTGVQNFAGVLPILKKSNDAQLEILKFTQEHGLEYLSGRCGPPAWAVTASQVLAYFGISVSSWWIVAAVVAVTALLVGLCATHALPASIQSKCKYLSIKLKFSF